MKFTKCTVQQIGKHKGIYLKQLNISIYIVYNTILVGGPTHDLTILNYSE